jgi:drug/metabolite transporter (DMT)-like permease
LIVKRSLADLPAVHVSAAALVLSTAMLAVPAGLTVDPAALTMPALGVLAVLDVACTGLAFWAFYTLIAEVGATRAVVSIYLTPAVAVVLGVTILDEELTATTTVGLVFIVVGSWISTRNRSDRERQPRLDHASGPDGS